MGWTDRVRANIWPHVRVTGATIVSFGAVTPLAVYTVTQTVLLPSPSAVAKMAGIATVSAGVVVHGLIPLGHWLQGARFPLQGGLGRGLAIGVEATMGGILLAVMGLVYGWLPQQAAVAGFTQLIRAYPLSLISKLMGDRIDAASDARIVSAWIMNANAGLNMELAKSGVISVTAALCEMAAFNLAVGVVIGVSHHLLSGSKGAD